MRKRSKFTTAYAESAVSEVMGGDQSIRHIVGKHELELKSQGNKLFVLIHRNGLCILFITATRGKFPGESEINIARDYTKLTEEIDPYCLIQAIDRLWR